MSNGISGSSVIYEVEVLEGMVEAEQGGNLEANISPGTFGCFWNETGNTGNGGDGGTNRIGKYR